MLCCDHLGTIADNAPCVQMIESADKKMPMGITRILLVRRRVPRRMQFLRIGLPVASQPLTTSAYVLPLTIGRDEDAEG